MHVFSQLMLINHTNNKSTSVSCDRGAFDFELRLVYQSSIDLSVALM